MITGLPFSGGVVSFSPTHKKQIQSIWAMEEVNIISVMRRRMRGLPAQSTARRDFGQGKSRQSAAWRINAG